MTVIKGITFCGKEPQLWEYFIFGSLKFFFYFLFLALGLIE